MTALALAARDSATMLRRDVRHSIRFPMMTVSGITVPVVLLLLFVGASATPCPLGSAPRWPGPAIYFLAPGILAMTAGFAAEATAVNVCTDMHTASSPGSGLWPSPRDRCWPAR